MAALAAFAFAGLLASGAAAATRSAVPRADRIGAAPAAKTLSLTLPLVADQAGLKQFATAVSTPGTPMYGQYESVGALAQRFGATAAVRDRAVRYLRGAGATHVAVDPTGLFVNATMPVSVAQRVFATRLSAYHVAGRAGGQTYLAPTTAVHVPAGLSGAVTSVVGLDTRPVLHGANPQVVSRGAAATHASAGKAGAGSKVGRNLTAPPPRTGTPAGCADGVNSGAFTPNQYRTAYGFDGLAANKLSGKGQKVAVLEIDGYKLSDLRAFEGCFGLPQTPITTHKIGISKPLAPGLETTLDLQVLGATAPDLKGIDVYESGAATTDLIKSFAAAVARPGHQPDVLSISVGACEQIQISGAGKKGVATTESILEIAAASGVSVLAASGDDGSTACLNREGNPIKLLAVSYPASSPFVTGVGGTAFSLNPDNSIAAQSVWNDTPLSVGAGGGGQSRLFKRPSYQTGSTASRTRAVPDVSMLADAIPGYAIYCSAVGQCIKKAGDSPWTAIGGTSAATPLLAGGMADVNQGLRAAGRQNVGFLNPALYTIGRSAAGPGVIADIVTGNNDIGTAFNDPIGCCDAAAGYDLASGLGSVNVAAFQGATANAVPKYAKATLSLPAQRHALAAHKVTANLKCSTACLAGVAAKISIAGGRSSTSSAGIRPLGKGGRTFTITLDGRTADAATAALRAHKTVTVSVQGAVVTPSGAVVNRTAVKTLTFRLEPKPRKRGLG